MIFCRNVAIYFSQADRTRLFERLAKHLHPTGVLLIGATESLQGITTRYTRKVYPQHCLLPVALGAFRLAEAWLYLRPLRVSRQCSRTGVSGQA